MIRVAPSMLAADYMHLDSEIDKVISSGADDLHFDVMDGTFVPAITFGSGILKMVSKKGIPVDAHLMIANPEKHIEEFASAGAKYITIHTEAAGFALRDTLMQIKSLGCKAGVSIKPFTSVKAIEEVLDIADLILIMTVEPGKGGQKLIPFTIDKVKEVKDLCLKNGYEKLIEVDGGINTDTAQLVKNAGANMLVAGSAFFKADDPCAFVKELKK